MSHHSFPFTIAQVVENILQLTVRERNSSGDLNIDCPFCNRKGKLNTSAKKNGFRCPACDKSGGILDLYADVHNIDRREAYREICELLGCDKSNPATTYNNYSLPSSNKQIEILRANRETIHQTYSMMLSLLSLANPHQKQLEERGLTKTNSLNFLGCKSVPAVHMRQNLCKRLVESGCNLEGVPGFFKNIDGSWGVKLSASGLLIPVCGIDGKIEGLQIRLDNPTNGRNISGFPQKKFLLGRLWEAGLHLVLQYII